MKPENIDKLIHQDGYIELLEEIHSIRESLIQQLHDTSTDRLQQISGRILQCDDILSMGGYERIAAISRK